MTFETTRIMEHPIYLQSQFVAQCNRVSSYDAADKRIIKLNHDRMDLLHICFVIFLIYIKLRIHNYILCNRINVITEYKLCVFHERGNLNLFFLSKRPICYNAYS